jgi:predicted RNA binding protein YcfA (HicA-like mRNA interferase family)
MTKLPHVSSRECIRALSKKGFYFVRQAGSHITLRRDHPFAQTTVPEKREIASGTLRRIIRDAGLTVDEFVELLNS